MSGGRRTTMKTFQQQPDRPEELRSRLAISEQECEQLQTALEDAEERIDRLTGENVRLRADKLSLAGEIAHLRYLLAKSNARLLEAWDAAPKASRPATGLDGEVT